MQFAHVIHWHFEAAFVFSSLGRSPTESCAAFKGYIFQSLVRQTSLNEKTHGVVLQITGGVREYSMDCIQKLGRDELDSALDVLRMMFDQNQPPPNTTAAWSTAAAAAGHHIGHLYVARGELAVDCERHQNGIFSLP